jgi:hypothetical protein
MGRSHDGGQITLSTTTIPPNRVQLGLARHHQKYKKPSATSLPEWEQLDALKK